MKINSIIGLAMFLAAGALSPALAQSVEIIEQPANVGVPNAGSFVMS